MIPADNSVEDQRERTVDEVAKRVSHVAFGCGFAVALLVISVLLVYLMWVA